MENKQFCLFSTPVEKRHGGGGGGTSDIYRTHMPLSNVVVLKKKSQLTLNSNGTKWYFYDLRGVPKNKSQLPFSTMVLRVVRFYDLRGGPP